MPARDRIFRPGPEDVSETRARMAPSLTWLSMQASDSSSCSLSASSSSGPSGWVHVAHGSSADFEFARSICLLSPSISLSLKFLRNFMTTPPVPATAATPTVSTKPAATPPTSMPVPMAPRLSMGPYVFLYLCIVCSAAPAARSTPTLMRAPLCRSLH